MEAKTMLFDTEETYCKTKGEPDNLKFVEYLQGTDPKKPGYEPRTIQRLDNAESASLNFTIGAKIFGGEFPSFKENGFTYILLIRCIKKPPAKAQVQNLCNFQSEVSKR